MADRPTTGSYFLGESGFSVYEEMGRQLRGLHWCRRPISKAARCDLVLGDRFQIPYGELRCAPLPSSSFFGGSRWVNYFQGSHKLTQKAAMAELLREADTTWADWMPRFFVLGGDPTKKADEREALLESIRAAPESVWIAKPSSGAKGEEITVMRGVEEAEHFLREKLERNPNSKKRYLVQRYVEQPLLLSHGRKFDVRVWALLTSPYSIFVFSQASCRTASVAFNLADIHNVHGHLTNHCLQKESKDFGRFETDNEMWLGELDAYLTNVLHKDTGTLAKVVLLQMANIVVRSLLAMKSQMEIFADEPFRCFQLFGYDFIISADLGVQLLEINGSPGVAERYLPVVVNSMLNLLGCKTQEPAVPSLPVPSNIGEGVSETPQPQPQREWGIEKEEFVLLWQEGDAVPQGLTL